ncbi:Unknown protein sequence [Pseudomonas syringae pv. maculicola]|nr:Unknown protein sequence [Pseudomonas syringae pv. maculicola]RMN78906.1 hypothetical protein ALQ52_104082 [Pseudomonas cannabina pv. alisalensis]
MLSRMKTVCLPAGKLISMCAYLTAHLADVPNMHSAPTDFNRVLV